MSPILIILILVALVVPIVYFSYLNAKKHNEAVKQFATQMNWNFYPEGEMSFVPGFSRSSLGAMENVKNKKLFNLISGQINGLNAAVFDFRYTLSGIHRDGAGNRQTIQKTQTIFYMQSPSANLPQFRMHPEGWTDKIAGFIGFSDINFPNHPNFSSGYKLQGANEAAIRQLFNDRILGFFENNPKVCVEGEGNYLIVFQHNVKNQPSEYQAKLQQAMTILNVLHGA